MRPPRHGGPGRGPDRGQSHGRRDDRQPPGQAGQRPPSGPKSQRASSVDPFDLFCAYYLGITKDKRYAPANVHDVARRFNLDAGSVRQVLQEHGMDPESMLNTDFDLTMAQIDIQVAPEGVDRVELAKQIYRDFRAAPRKPRDWRRLLEEDARENAKIFGRRN